MFRNSGNRSFRLVTRFSLVAAALLSGCTDGAVAPTAVEPTGASFASVSGPPSMIVVLEPKVNAAEIARTHGIKPKYVYTRVLNGFAGPVSEAARAALLRDQRVSRVVLDGTVRTTGTQSSPTWGLDRVDQRPLPLDKAYSYNFTGQGVTAYIFDTGIRYDHAEFEGRAVPGFDAFGGNGSDCHGHGTHVAGTAGGKTYGVAKQVRLVSVRVLDCNGSGSYSGIIAGMDWVAKNNTGPAVANFSIGGGKSEELNRALRSMISAGVQASVAAGNDNGDACLKSPASTLEAVTVGATTSSDARASYSNFGSCLDLFAPGSSIVSASHSSTTGTSSKSGTSMAAPHVAGVMALFLQENRALTPAQLRDAVWNATTKTIVTDALSDNAHLVYSLSGATAAPPPSEPAPVTAPAAPTSLAHKLVALNRVDLSWVDQSSNEESFEIERRTGSGSYALLARVGAGTKAYSDISVQKSQTYTYRVRAVNSGGASVYSNETSVTVTCKTRKNSLNCV